MTKTHILHLYCEPEPAVSTAAARKGYQSSQMIDITRRNTLGLYGELKTSSLHLGSIEWMDGRRLAFLELLLEPNIEYDGRTLNF